MELVLFFSAVIGAGVATFWFCGSLYGLFRRPAVYFPFWLAVKMTLAALVGLIVYGFGAVVAGTVVFVLEFRKRPDFRPLTGFLAGGVISLAGSAVMFMLGFTLAWQM